MGKTADNAVERAGAVIRQFQLHGDGLAEQIFVLDILVLADELQLVLEQGAQLLVPAHGTQQQDVFAEGVVTERVRACWLRGMG